jgi:hypothetical protein
MIYRRHFIHGMRCRQERRNSMQNQLQAYEKSREFLAGINAGIMDMIRQTLNHPEETDHPDYLSREDLKALIRRRPQVYGQFAGFLDQLPSRRKP